MREGSILYKLVNCELRFEHLWHLQAATPLIVALEPSDYRYANEALIYDPRYVRSTNFAYIAERDYVAISRCITSAVICLLGVCMNVCPHLQHSLNVIIS